MSDIVERPLTLHRTPRLVTPTSAHAAVARWSIEEVQAVFAMPFPELMHSAQSVHREHFDTSQIEFATLLSVETGGCPEDCGYCPQAARYDTGVEPSKLMEPAEVLQAAQRAKEAGATRFCMGAAW